MCIAQQSDPSSFCHDGYVCTCPTHRAQLQREKQAREDAERQKKDLEDRVKQYEDDAKQAHEGKYFMQSSKYTF